MGLGEYLRERLEPPEEPDVDQSEVDRLLEEALDRFIEQELEERDEKRSSGENYE